MTANDNRGGGAPNTKCHSLAGICISSTSLQRNFRSKQLEEKKQKRWLEHKKWLQTHLKRSFARIEILSTAWRALWELPVWNKNNDNLFYYSGQTGEMQMNSRWVLRNRIGLLEQSQKIKTKRNSFVCLCLYLLKTEEQLQEEIKAVWGCMAVLFFFWSVNKFKNVFLSHYCGEGKKPNEWCPSTYH